MDFELAKRLKDTGFPQGGHGHWIGPPAKFFWRHEDRVYVPTLGELIEACNVTNRHFVLKHQVGEVNGWVARIGTFWSSRSPTPAEAVARLWLVLQRK